MGVPSRLGRYVVRRRLGSGGFATVWLAYDEQLDAEVAVKVLADNWAHDDSVRRRFLEEGRFLRRVESEHVVQVHDVGELEDGRPFLVLTYADRGTLADRLKKEPLALEAAIGVVVEVGRGLQALHRRGLLHRDVKPANVLFRSTDEGDRAVLSDLGLGKALDEVSRITMPGGTPSYVAPEQAMGDRLDQRADQYSLGAVAYAALTGRSPHQVDGLGAAGRVAAPPPPSSLGFAVPDRVDAAIVRALDPDREKRWPDVASFTRELVGALDETTQNFVPAAKSVIARDAETVAAPVGAGGVKTEPAADAETATVDPTGETTALSDSNQPTVIKTTPGETAAEDALPGPKDSGADDKAEAATAAVGLLDAPTDAQDGKPADAQDGKATIAVPKRRRRGRWVIAALLALIIGGGAGFFGQRYYEPRRVITVGSGQFTAKLPKELAGFVVEGTWTPPGAPAEQQSFRVSKDESWGAAGSATHGLFVGVMRTTTDPDKLLASGQSYGCNTDTEPTAATVNGYDARERVSTGCPGGNLLLQRVATSPNGYSLLIQVQVAEGDEAAATKIADSIAYSGGGIS
ncbi:protein kinase [Kribbella qitaiheensis]|uniref:non-specific serine/threonine protein kinase n=1 Tax=Kribbella qitaiheensis TaxID=1544730 RepID=A0A7G6WZP8_9ACTN|nr:serine/threonine-protein kinase [Kribbella qitaiheensis]QNE19463.1 protein kinase [Kribbella qitaiheensis]